MPAFGCKSVSLVALTVQTCLHAVLMKMSVNGSNYSTSVAVVMDELIKLTVCSLLLFWFYMRDVRGNRYTSLSDPDNSSPSTSSSWWSFLCDWFLFVESEVFPTVPALLAMAVPAVCFAVQKNLLFLAIKRVDPVVFQVLLQGKMLTTAFFSYLILGKQFSRRQKIALLAMFVGVCCVEMSDLTGASTAKSDSGHGLVLGALALLVACFTSGFSAVYIERAIKSTSNHEEPKPYTIWVRNIQLSIFGTIAACSGALAQDYAAIRTNGAFSGFNGTVWSLVLLSSLGGLLIALVMKYADNILKTFSTAVAIIITEAVSAIFFHFNISILSVVGTVLVLAAVHLYSSGGAPVATISKEEDEEDSPVNRSIELAALGQRD